ncbi:MAG: phytanoyl-CoA dioxygenase family protein [Capsulimonadaceae bacterium]|nr:phytanoyl-CoA dioxygenase family protein [Capsulimonadaceae bacterium]
MVLTDQQVRFYNTFGYLEFRQLFTVAEIAEFATAFDEAMNSTGKDVGVPGQVRRLLDAPIEHSRVTCALLDDERVTSIASALLGKDFNYAGGDGTLDAGDTSWHIDGNWGEHFAAKMIFFLDPVRRDTGCLRIVPGSHRPDHHIRAYRLDPNRSEQQFGIDPRDFPGNVPLEADPGDVIIFNHDLFHALFGGNAHRREFTINLTKKCHNQVDLMTLREYLRFNVGTRSWGSMYTSLMLETADPERLTHLEQVRDLYDQLSKAPVAL